MIFCEGDDMDMRGCHSLTSSVGLIETAGMRREKGTTSSYRQLTARTQERKKLSEDRDYHVERKRDNKKSKKK